MADASPGPENVPDIMNDHAFDPLQRLDTRSSLPASEAGIADTCRICRSEGTSEEPLFYPCKCSGSIKFVHQECLMEWLSHSHKKHCELCKTPFRFTKLYDADMPKTLPFVVFVQRACLHTAIMFLRALRATLVSIVWLMVLPWLIRWGWRWMFWVADVGWAREAFVRKTQNQSALFRAGELVSRPPINTSNILIPDSVYAKLEQIWENQFGSLEGFSAGRAIEVMKGMLATLGLDFDGTLGGLNSTVFGPVNVTWPQADASILSSVGYISELTSNPAMNRAILDVFEGQLITCVVITGFILVFLIREWVVQQQPLVNLDNLNHDEQARQRAERRGRERLRRQLELLDEARARLDAVESDTREAIATPVTEDALELGGQPDSTENIQKLVLRAMEKWQENVERQSFGSEFENILRVFKASDKNLDVLLQAVETMENLPDDMKAVWVNALRTLGRKTQQPNSSNDEKRSQSLPNARTDGSESSSTPRRPPMPDRDTSSRIARIRRTLEETDALLLDVRSEERLASSHDDISNAVTEPPREPPYDGIIDEPDHPVVQDAAEMPSVSHPTPPSRSQQKVDIVTANTQGLPRNENVDEIPITNAGPDAKINIKRGGNGKLTAVPAPQDGSLGHTETHPQRSSAEGSFDDADSSHSAGADESLESPGHSTNPFHPESPEPDHRDGDTFNDRVASVFREEFGLDEAEHRDGRDAAEQPRQNEADATNETASETNATENRQAPGPPTILQQLADWFWGDIQLQERAQEPAIPPDEERVNEINDIQARFVPVQNAHPVLAARPAEDDNEEAEHDPEVVAAAQQAGLDPEAIEDAEDLEGIFELIGLQGPIIGLFQTSCFCSVLVQGTIIGAVGLPYLWGKLVLSFLGSPVTFLIKFPLQTASVIADVLIDAFLAIGGWCVVGLSFLSNLMLLPFESLTGSTLVANISNFGRSTAHHAGARLMAMFKYGATSDNMNWNWAWLRGSVHSHHSLQNIQDEVNFVLNCTGSTITSVVDTISSGSMALVWERSVNALSHVLEIPARLLAGVEVLEQYTRPLLEIARSLRNGALTFQTSSSSDLNPSLVYWNSTDRGLAVLTGYIALAALAAVYVALDRPITRTPSGQKTEKLIRDTLRQAGGVLKVILIISIEMLVFPLYCGLLLDLAFLPLFQGASVATRWAFAVRAPSTFCFVHWFVGTCYMFHFALFVGMCRKILRKGVLWFIRDPDDPTFHPVRDVLERNVTTQLRKIAFSALVYGALVILCLGGVIWSIGHVFDGLFPIHWISTEPVLEFPMDLLLYNFITPLLIKLFKPSDAVHAMYAWWLRRCARVLRLSHFLFDERRKDEEGRHVHKSWSSFLLLKKGDLDATSTSQDLSWTVDNADVPEVYFERDGKYVLTPCNDQYRPPKPGEAFIYATDDDVFIADKDGRRNDHFAKIYVPPSFRLRVTLFMVCLWMFSAFTGLCATLVPLVFGRRLFAFLVSSETRVNDIYAYSVGAYIIFGAIFIGYKYKATMRYLKTQAASVHVNAWIRSATRYTLQALKCIYVYGFLGLILPVVFALILQFYLILPLHTYLIAAATSSLTTITSNNSTVLANTTANTTGIMADFVHEVVNPPNVTSAPSTAKLADTIFIDHSIHLLADYALGLLYVRIAIRFVITAPASRAAEAFRRITADGYLKPNARLATRFFVLPATLLATVVLLIPLVVARLAILCAGLARRKALSAVAKAAIYRYAYPLTAVGVVVMVGLRGLADATSRWRARIRDEVYLVGERLHNFGEKKPPVGSRSVVRKDR